MMNIGSWTAGWVSLAHAFLWNPAPIQSPPIDRTAVENMAAFLVQQEDSASMRADTAALDTIFLREGKEARQAHQEALQRVDYLSDWTTARKIHFDNVKVQVHSWRIHWLNSTEVALQGADMARYQYHHLTGSARSCWFGLGVNHAWVFKEVKGRWYIKADRFIDPMNQNTRLSGSSALPAVIQVKPEHRMAAPPSPGAANAIRFAENYCGVAPGCGNKNQYHPDYQDFNQRGGDCTNFISQVLLAGGFRENSRWSWNSEMGGTDAWINATRLSQYLRRSGRGTVYAVGSLPELLKPDENGVDALSRLRLGDFIAYFESSRVVHFAVVVGFDADGYPLVVSHSADRYRVPWDLGWDRTTTYLLYHIHYPDRSGEAPSDQTSPSTTTSPVAIK